MDGSCDALNEMYVTFRCDLTEILLGCSRIWPPDFCNVFFWHPHTVCCSVLQCVAVCCSVLQCVAVCCNVSAILFRPPHTVCCKHSAVWRSLLQTFRNVSLDLWIQYVAVCCSVLQCVAVCCSVLQCVAVCCKSVADYCSVSALFRLTSKCNKKHYEHSRCAECTLVPISGTHQTNREVPGSEPHCKKVAWVAWLIHRCDMTRACVTWLTKTCGMTRPYDLLTHVTWLMNICDYVSDMASCAIRCAGSYEWDMSHICVSHVTYIWKECDMTHEDMWRDSFVWFVDPCDMTHEYLWPFT